MKKLFFICSMSFTFSLYAEDDPCRGDGMLLNIVNRPSFSESACTVSAKKILFEGGFQIQQLIDAGSQENFPLLTARMGLSKNTEFFINPSNYIHQSIQPTSGGTPTWLGVKHRIFYNKDWIISGEGLFSPPSKSEGFGSPNMEGTINGILYHQINTKISWQIQLGLSQFSDPALEDGRTYQSVNPDLVLSYNFKNKASLYLESFAQTKTSSTESFGMVQGIGFIYLVNSKTTLDIEFYQRITGTLLGFERFIGAGFTRLF